MRKTAKIGRTAITKWTRISEKLTAAESMKHDCECDVIALYSVSDNYDYHLKYEFWTSEYDEK